MKHRYTKSCPPNLYSLFISSAVGSPTVLKYCKCRARYDIAYEPLFSGFFWFFFPFDFRFDLCVKAKGHKKDLGRKNGRDNITTSYTCLVYVVDPVYLRHVLRRLELSIKPGCSKICVWSQTYSLKPTCVLLLGPLVSSWRQGKRFSLSTAINRFFFYNVSSTVKADKLWNSAAIFAFLSGMV